MQAKNTSFLGLTKEALGPRRHYGLVRGKGIFGFLCIVQTLYQGAYKGQTREHQGGQGANG